MIFYSGMCTEALGEFVAQRTKLFKRFKTRSLVTPNLTSRVLNNKIISTEFGYALDNGAWGSFINNKPFDFDSFYLMIEQLHSCADFIVVPDVVANADETVKLAHEHVPIIKSLTDSQLCICWQDGMHTDQIKEFIQDGIGIFVGGTDAEKKRSSPYLSRICERYQVPFHIGRVNSYKRAKWAKDIGATSIDGTGWINYLLQFRIQYRFEIEDYQLFQSSEFKAREYLIDKKQRMEFFNISQEQINQFFKKLNEVDTNGVGFRDDRNKENYPFLWWN